MKNSEPAKKPTSKIFLGSVLAVGTYLVWKNRQKLGSSIKSLASKGVERMSEKQNGMGNRSSSSSSNPNPNSSRTQAAS